MAKRKTSDSVRKMRLIILGLSILLVVAVVLATWFTLSRESQDGDLSWRADTTTTTAKRIAGEPDQTTDATKNVTTNLQTTTGVDGLPYNKNGSDVFANWDGKYSSAEVIVKQDSNGKWCAYVNDKKANDCTGVYVNEHGWWFLRDGQVDFTYRGIAGNNSGKWFVHNGMVDFDYSGAFTPFDGHAHYTIIEGHVENQTND